MKKRSHLVYFGIALLPLVVIIAGFSSFKNKSISAPELGFESELSSELEPISTDERYEYVFLKNIKLEAKNSNYSFKKGKVFRDMVEINQENDKDEYDRVLRLASFYQWNKEDPLFFATTLDTGKFDKSVTALDIQQRKFLKKQKYENQLYPIEFLLAFSEASKQYQKFSGNISEKNAAILVEKISKAQASYGNDISALKAKMDFLASGLGNAKFVGLGSGSYTSAKIIIADLEKMLENEKVASNELEKRKKCLRESASFCERLALKAKRPKSAAGKKLIAPTILSKEKLNFIEGQKYSGPFEVNSKCWDGEGKKYIYKGVNCPSGRGYCMEDSVLATDAFFVTKLKKELPLDNYFLERGAKATPQSATTAYACNDLEYKPALVTLGNFHSKYKNDRLFAEVEKQKNKNVLSDEDEWTGIIKEGILMENNFFDARYPSEENLEKLGNFYLFAFAYSTINGMESEFLGAFLERSLMVREKVSDVHLSINNVLVFFSIYGQRRDIIGDDEGGEEYVYPIRSHYSLMFLNFASSVWRSAEKLEFIRKIENKNAAGIGSAIIDLKTAEGMFGEENLSKWRKINNEAIRKEIDYPAENSL